MLGKAYAQRPLDGTSETGPVLLRLLEDGLVGAVSITFATERAERKKTKQKKTSFLTRRSRRGERTEDQTKGSILFTMTDLTHHANNFPERF